MTDDVLKKTGEKEMPLDSRDIERTVSSITGRFRIDLSQELSTRATVSVPVHRPGRAAGRPQKREIGNAESDAGVDYRVLELIKKGTVAEICQAEQTSLKRTVAIKLLKEEARLKNDVTDMFMEEAFITGELSHPNIIPVHDAGIDAAGRPFYVMKNVQGVVWDSLLHPADEQETKKAERYTLDDHLDILDSVCNAAAFAHSRNVIHRDLKPANVLIGEFGEIIVMNWGLTVSVEGAGSISSLSESNAFGGTIGYMAPEMACADTAAIGRQSDIYLLGAILYEILTGHPPHDAPNAKDALAAALQNRISPPDDRAVINRDLLAIALRAMETRPDERYASVQEFQKELKSYKATRESRLLREKARLLLDSAEKRGELATGLRAVAMLQEALHLWDGDAEAKELLAQAEKFCAGLPREFSAPLLRLAVRGELRRLLEKLVAFPVYVMLFLVPVFFYFFIVWSAPLYEVGKIKVRQVYEQEEDDSAVTSEHIYSNVYFLFDEDSLYQVEISGGRLRMSRIAASRVVDTEENKCYIEDRLWVVTRTPFRISIEAQSSEVLAVMMPHERVLNPLILLKVRKFLNEFKTRKPRRPASEL